MASVIKLSYHKRLLLTLLAFSWSIAICFIGFQYLREKEYKSEYLENRLYSSATVLYCSQAFSQVFDMISAPQEESTVSANVKIGRNEPCPCGSGKKFKNCCGKA